MAHPARPPSSASSSRTSSSCLAADPASDQHASQTAVHHRLPFAGPSTGELPISSSDFSSSVWANGSAKPHAADRNESLYPPRPGGVRQEGRRIYLPGDAGMSAGGRGSFLTSVGGRRRLHPVALVPAFLLGLAWAFFGFPGMAVSYWKPSDSRVRSWWLGGSGRHAAPEPLVWPDSSRLSSEREAPYLVHPTNGHIYLRTDFSNQLWSLSSPSLPSSPADPPTHPIHALIRNASEAWEAKLARQSQTLAQAVAEYKRRYGRTPPKGFDRWWEWVKENNIVLVDEYDSINEIIEPFWALPSSVIEKRREPYLNHSVFNTFIIKDGQVTNVGGKKDAARTQDQLALMKPFLKHLPDVNITMSHHDGPSVFMAHATKQRHLDYARIGKTIPPERIDDVDNDPALWGFLLSCPPESRIRRAELGLEVDALPGGPSFIGLEHAKAMDMCENPEWQYLHGFTSWPGFPPGLLKPIFSFASGSFSSDLLETPLEQFDDVEHNPHVPPWEKKVHNRLLWKGRTTGVWFDTVRRWRSSQRVRLHFLGTAKEGKRRVRFLEAEEKGGTRGKIVEKVVELVALNKRYLNASFVGELGQCTVDDGACEAVAKHLAFDPYIDWDEQNMYKYVFDVDGNSWSGRFRRLLASGSVVFKSTIWPEWYRDHIQPWHHYVPARIDYADVYDLMAFFNGDLEGKNGHEEVAKAMAERAREWVRKHWRYEDLQAYTWRMYLEWARVSSLNREDMDFGEE